VLGKDQEEHLRGDDDLDQVVLESPINLMDKENEQDQTSSSGPGSTKGLEYIHQQAPSIDRKVGLATKSDFYTIVKESSKGKTRLELYTLNSPKIGLRL